MLTYKVYSSTGQPVDLPVYWSRFLRAAQKKPSRTYRLSPTALLGPDTNDDGG